VYNRIQKTSDELNYARRTQYRRVRRPRVSRKETQCQLTQTVNSLHNASA